MDKDVSVDGDVDEDVGSHFMSCIFLMILKMSAGFGANCLLTSLMSMHRYKKYYQARTDPFRNK